MFSAFENLAFMPCSITSSTFSSFLPNPKHDSVPPQRPDDFNKKNVQRTIGLFRKDLVVKERDRTSLRTVATVTKRFKSETEAMYKKQDRQSDIFTRICFKRPSDLIEHIGAESIPYVLAGIAAVLPALTRLALGQEPIPFAEDIPNESLEDEFFGTERIVRFVAAFYIVSTVKTFFVALPS